MIKNRFKDDYSWNARLNGKGRVVDDICYTGTYYILPFTEQEKKKSNWLNMAFAAVLLILQVAAGMVNQDSSRTFCTISRISSSLTFILCLSFHFHEPESSGILLPGRSVQLLERSPAYADSPV